MKPEPYRPVSYLRWNAARRPEALAVLNPKISFHELLWQVGRFKSLMSERGVQAGDVVGVRLPNIWQYVVLELAIPDLGAVILPLPPSLGEHELRWVQETARPAPIIAEPELGELEKARLPTTAAPSEAADPSQIVEIAMTSGTTGIPKLASLSARLKQVTFEGFTSRLEITDRDRVLPMTPLTQGIGGMCLYCLRRDPHAQPPHRPAERSRRRGGRRPAAA